MPASRYLRVASAISLVLAGAGQVAAVQAQPAAGEAAPAPVQLIELTTASGETTELAQAGLSEEEPGSGAGAEVPAGTVEGNGVAPARASLLAAATDAPDLERDAGLLTEPLEVDGFLVAGFTWSGSEALPTGTQIYLRVREGGVWSSWYLNEAADAGPDDAEGNGGTDEFVTGGADAVQAAVVSGGRALPTDLTLALVPAKPAGEEVLSDDDVTTTQAGPTAIAQDTAVTQEQLVDRLVDATAPVGSEDGTTADEGTDVSETTGATASAATSAGHGVNLDLPTALAATTTANGLPVPVVTRAEWGANQAYMTWSPKYANAAHVVVHHTAGTNNYTAAQSASIVAGIYYYHAVTLDWGDIGYNFLVDKYGQVFEGRYGTLSSAAGKMVIGGHARGVNTGTMGISMMGNYVSTSPTDVQIDRVGKMAGWFLKRSGVTNASASASFTILTTEKYKAGQVVNLPRILAHRDVGYTTCPGDGGYSKMGQIRSVAQSQISSGSTGGGSSTPAAPTWRLVDKTWYLYGADGARLTGWQKVNGSWYYLSPVNGAMATGWQAISGKWYYLTESGAMATGWKKLGSHWYYFQTSGAMVTAWQDIAGLRYYFTANGDMASGWLDTGGTTYYLTASGAMHTGWFKDGDA
ncbi:N-acetylmuramoyl-L-alanine amidase, partial [Actinomyces urogenitalis]|uniref:N-acetylmuramoyl-L-alanine amidase n=1 Tax=Actinomyces urogenitalis TaxID=103621 RepID=UPI0006612ECD